MTDPDYDPDAPYGRNPKGEPYKRSLEEREALTARLQRGRQAKARDGGRTGGAPPPRAASKANSSPGYAAAVVGLATIPQMALMALSRWKPIFAADAMAIKRGIGPVALAIEDIAIEDERWASAIDAIAKVGPWGALVTAAMPMLAQMAANHGAAPVMPELGMVEPIQLLREAGFDVRTADPGDQPSTPASPDVAETGPDLESSPLSAF